jgi:hypothetical protein
MAPDLGPERGARAASEAALRDAVAFDIGFGGVDRAVARQELHVPERSPCPVHQLGGIGDEGAPPRMRGAAFEAQLGIEGRFNRMTGVSKSAGARMPRALLGRVQRSTRLHRQVWLRSPLRTATLTARCGDIPLNAIDTHILLHT